MVNASWFVLAGMAIVFTTLGLLMLTMGALNWWLSPRAEKKAHSTKTRHA